MDKELDALIEINSLLKDLDKSSILRIIQWITDKYLPDHTHNESQSILNNKSIANSKPAMVHSSPIAQEYSTLADLLSVSLHKTETDRFLLAAYWYTNGASNITFRSSDLTALLKEIGYTIKKVSNPIDTLKNKKPVQYIVQIKKNSKTKGKNGRMTLKLTTAGIKAAEDLINYGTTNHQ